MRSLGFVSDRLPSRTFQGTPTRHRGVHVGNVYLVEKGGGEEFTDEDEEELRPFASQAPYAIANARTCRDERRARAGREALVETSPVGVAVFDARTGHPVSFNREARRTVESPRTPGRSPEHPLQAMTSPPTTLSSLPHSQRLHERRCARRSLRPRYRFPEGMSCDMDIISRTR